MGKKRKDDRHKAKHATFWYSQETEDTINKIAVERRLTKSEVLRELVDKGLNMQKDDALYDMIRGAIREILTPQVERLATINAKATQISGAAYFLLVYVLRMYFPESDKSMVDDVAAQARQLGIQYLKLRQGMDIDEFIKSGIKTMNDDNAGWKGARDDD